MSITRRLFAICIGLAILSLVVVGVEIRTTAASAGSQPAASFALIDTPFKPGNRVPAARRSLPRSFQQAPQTETTIGENKRHTNIQVLKEFPDSQLIPMMNLMSASLGVKCDFCHTAKDGHLDPASDDKPEKKTAREMITMTLSINKTTFNGRTEVGCYTCHRGRTGPMGTPALPLPEPPPRPARTGPGTPGGPGGGGAAGAAAPAPAQLPTADEILNKYVAAIGGQAAIDKLKSRTMKGTFTAANGQSATFEVDQSAPDKFHLTFVLPQTKMERGFDGAAGWEKGPRGVTDLSGQLLADMKGSFSLFSYLKLKEQFTRMSVRKDKLDGRDVYMIAATRVDTRRERLYFDAETGLLLRRSSPVQTPIGVIPTETNFEDYRDVDGVKVPFTTSTLTIDQGSSATLKYTEIKNNAPVDESIFRRPPATPAAAQPKP